MNAIEQSCIEHLKSEGFAKQCLESFSKNIIPEPPKPPEIPEHPLGDDYLAVIELIGDWKQRAIAAETELLSLRKSLEAKQTTFSNEMDITKQIVHSVNELMDEYFGKHLFPYFRNKLKNRFGI